MNRSFRIGLAALVLAALGLANAPRSSAQGYSDEPGTGWVLRAGYSHTDFDDWGAADPSGHALLFSVAYAIQPWIEVEATWLDASRVSGEVIAAPITILPDTRTVEARALMIGPRVGHRFATGVSIYATAGYAYTSHYYRRVGGTLAIPDFTTGETRHDDEIFYGAGVGYVLNDTAGIHLDYRRLEFSNLPMESLGIMLSYRF